MEEETAHNVRVEHVMESAIRTARDPSVSVLDLEFEGAWRKDGSEPQFGGVVVFPRGRTLLEADLPSLLGGAGRAPSPLSLFFFGAMASYCSTFATQAALGGLSISDLHVQLWVSVDFAWALGQGTRAPLSALVIDLEVDTDASELEMQRVKRLTDERCPAIWAMGHPVPHRTVARARRSRTS